MTHTLAILSLFTLAGGVFITPLAQADPPAVAPVPRGAKPLPYPILDAREVVVFAPNRPVRVRVRVDFEGNPIADAWRNKLRTAFRFFDRDKDGSLNAAEAQTVFSDSGMVRMLQNGLYQVTPNDIPSVKRFDTDNDGVVSFDEFAAIYKNSSNQLFTPGAPVAQNPTMASATEALFKLMDANDDDKLTKPEVDAVEKLLVTQDVDEDECLSQTELVAGNTYGSGNIRLGQPVQVMRGGGQPTANNTSEHVTTYALGRVPGTLTQVVIKKYDTNGDFDLTREEVGFDTGTFTKLDRDSNDKLDGEELDMWRTGPPDLEVQLSFSEEAKECRVNLLTPREIANDRGFKIRHVDLSRLVIVTGRQPIEFWAFKPDVPTQQRALKTQYQYLFTQAAMDKDHVLAKDLEGPQAVRYQFLRTVFDATDTNADGKMTREEFDAYFDLQESFRGIGLAFTPAVETPTLFQLLDSNSDGRLGVRELRTAWERLRKLEPGEGDVVTKSVIQPSVSLRLSSQFERAYIQQRIVYQNPNQVTVPQKGPVWFRRMDRNADGDISRSEYLGTTAEFDTIDADSDDLISLEEAETYDKAMREKE